MFDSASFKQQFPLFSHPENRQLVYLDNAATTQRPQCVIDAVTDFYSRYNANTHRSSHRLARAATAMVERVRRQAAEFLGAEQAAEIVFTRGATEALNLLAYALTASLQPGDEILLSPAEHHANLVPWQMAAQRRQLNLRFLPAVQGVPQLSALTDCVTSRTRIVSLTGASNALGCRLDIAGVKPRLPQACLLLVDASQLLAHERIDVQALGCDFVVGSAHKFYGPTGIGLLYGRWQLLQHLPPWQGGGEMISQVRLQDSDYAPAPHRFEAGTSALAAIAGLGACIDWLQACDRAAMATYESHLNRYLHIELQALEQQLPLRLLTRFENNVGIAALLPALDAGFTAADIGHWLDEQDIAVRAGHHCAQPLMDSIGSGGSVRISLAAYNNREDIDRLLQALRDMPGATDTMAVSQPRSGDGFGDDLGSIHLNQLTTHNNWQKRYRQLTRWAVQLSRKPQIRSEENRVRGCESVVWMTHRCKGGRHQFAIDTDSRVIQGLSVLLLLLIDNRSSAEIAALDIEATFAELGLEKYLSPSRSNGFRALVTRARQLATDSDQ